MDWSARSPRWRSSCCSGRSLARFSKALDACCARSRPEIGDPAYCHARIRHTPLMDASIAVSREGSIATVVLNRPDKLNALTKAMWRSLGETIDRLSADDSLRCVIVRGAGEKAFSPGNDIAGFESERANKAQAIEYGGGMHATSAPLARCRHPLVPQIHGSWPGGGLEIAALCDLRICGTSSRFGAPIKNLGLVMAYPEMAPLVRLAGADVALEILLEGRIFGAAEAKEKRLVTRVVPEHQVANEALAWAPT